MKEIGQVTRKVKPDFTGWVDIGYTTLENIFVNPEWLTDDDDEPVFKMFQPSTITFTFKPTYVNTALLLGIFRPEKRKRLSRMHSLYHRRRK